MSARLDGFLSEEGDFNFVEYNAESPGGLGYGNALSDAFARMPIMQEFSRRYDARALPVRTFVFDSLAWGLPSLGRKRVAEHRHHRLARRRHLERILLMKAEFESHGCRVKIADPEELEYRERSSVHRRVRRRSGLQKSGDR